MLSEENEDKIVDYGCKIIEILEESKDINTIRVVRNIMADMLYELQTEIYKQNSTKRGEL